MLRALGTLVLALLAPAAGGCSLAFIPFLSDGTGSNGLVFFLWAAGLIVAVLAGWGIWRLWRKTPAPPDPPDAS